MLWHCTYTHRLASCPNAPLEPHKHTHTHIAAHVKLISLWWKHVQEAYWAEFYWSSSPPLHCPGFYTPAGFLFPYLHLYQTCPLSFNVIDSPPSKSSCHMGLCSCDLHRNPGLKIEKTLIPAVLYHFCPAVNKAWDLARPHRCCLLFGMHNTRWFR